MWDHFQRIPGQSSLALRPFRRPKSSRKGFVEKPAHSELWCPNTGGLGSPETTLWPHDASHESHLLRTTAKGCPTETLAHRVARWVRIWVLNRSSFGIFERGWDWLTRSSSCGPPPRDVVDELILSHVLAPFGCFDLRRDGSGTVTCSHASPLAGALRISKGLTVLGLQKRGRVASCPATSLRRKCYSSLPSTASVVSSLLGISRASWTRHPGPR